MSACLRVILTLIFSLFFLFGASNLEKKSGELFLSNEMVLWLAHCDLLGWIHAGGEKEEGERRKRGGLDV